MDVDFVLFFGGGIAALCGCSVWFFGSGYAHSNDPWSSYRPDTMDASRHMVVDAEYTVYDTPVHFLEDVS